MYYAVGKKRKEITNKEVNILYNGIRNNITYILKNEYVQPNELIKIILYTIKNKIGINNSYDELRIVEEKILRRILGEETKHIELVHDNNVYKFTVNNNVRALFTMIKDIIIKDQYSTSIMDFNGKIVVDAGANIGVFSVYAAKKGASVYSYEPVENTYSILVENLILNNINAAYVVNSGLSNKESVSTIYYDTFNNGGATLNPDYRYGKKKQKVNITTIDALHADVDFIKVDVESHELQVIKGAQKTISERKPVIVCAAYHEPWSKEEILTYMHKAHPEYGYVLTTHGEEDLVFIPSNTHNRYYVNGEEK